MKKGFFVMATMVFLLAYSCQEEEKIQSDSSQSSYASLETSLTLPKCPADPKGKIRYFLDRDKDGYGAGKSRCTGRAKKPPLGWSTNNLDCNDRDPKINPAAKEILCDGINQNCSGIYDDDIDADNDFFTYCHGDCDDNDPQIHPYAEEITCDGIDQNCNGLSDDALDADGDGVSACTDCNDSDPTIYPGAEEILCDVVDQNCNGLGDDCQTLTISWCYDPSANYYGQMACPGNSIQDLIIDANGCFSTNIPLETPFCYLDATDGPRANNIWLAQNQAPSVILVDGTTYAVPVFTQWEPNANHGAGYLVCLDSTAPECESIPVDNDGDGYNSDTDCNDNDSQIHPGAVEITCDGTDQNCNDLDDCPDITIKWCYDPSDNYYGQLAYPGSNIHDIAIDSDGCFNATLPGQTPFCYLDATNGPRADNVWLADSQAPSVILVDGVTISAPPYIPWDPNATHGAGYLVCFDQTAPECVTDESVKALTSLDQYDGAYYAYVDCYPGYCHFIIDFRVSEPIGIPLEHYGLFITFDLSQLQIDWAKVDSVKIKVSALPTDETLLPSLYLDEMKILDYSLLMDCYREGASGVSIIIPEGCTIPEVIFPGSSLGLEFVAEPESINGEVSIWTFEGLDLMDLIKSYNDKITLEIRDKSAGPRHYYFYDGKSSNPPTLEIYYKE